MKAGSENPIADPQFLDKIFRETSITDEVL